MTGSARLTMCRGREPRVRSRARMGHQPSWIVCAGPTRLWVAVQGAGARGDWTSGDGAALGVHWAWADAHGLQGMHGRIHHPASRHGVGRRTAGPCDPRSRHRRDAGWKRSPALGVTPPQRAQLEWLAAPMWPWVQRVLPHPQDRVRACETSCSSRPSSSAATAASPTLPSPVPRSPMPPCRPYHMIYDSSSPQSRVIV